MATHRQIFIILGCCMAAMLILNSIVFDYFHDKFIDEEVGQLSDTLLAERKKNLQEIVDNALTVLRATAIGESTQAIAAEMNKGPKNPKYMFVVDPNGIFRANSTHPDMVGKRINDLGNPAERGLIEYVVGSARADQGDYLEYPGRHSPLNLIGVELIYFKRFEKLNWTIGAGLDADDINAVTTVAAKRRDELSNAYFNQGVVFITMEFLILVLCLAAGAKLFRVKLKQDPLCDGIKVDAVEAKVCGNSHWKVKPTSPQLEPI